ncbi:MAG: hypothetical protein DMD83_20875 [Candidatus Rokuibacteriota bacterium]|nr:MAG: hypothetical protein DMD83_20875 [Candidatus Rokubacteria bacterium]
MTMAGLPHRAATEILRHRDSRTTMRGQPLCLRAQGGARSHP